MVDKIVEFFEIDDDVDKIDYYYINYIDKNERSSIEMATGIHNENNNIGCCENI